MIILLDNSIFIMSLDMTVEHIFSFELFFANDTTIWSFFGMATLMTLEQCFPVGGVVTEIAFE